MGVPKNQDKNTKSLLFFLQSHAVEFLEERKAIYIYIYIYISTGVDGKKYTIECSIVWLLESDDSSPWSCDITAWSTQHRAWQVIHHKP